MIKNEKQIVSTIQKEDSSSWIGYQLNDTTDSNGKQTFYEYYLFRVNF